MEAKEIVVSDALPTVAEYIELRTRTGWLIGLARVMGDGILYFFLADLIVDPGFRGEKLGDRLMRLVTSYFDRCAAPGASITLVALRGSEAFYERHGFVRCPDGPFGTGMHYSAAPPPSTVPSSG